MLVHLPGGDLTITVLPGMKNVLMRGPALHVFDGELARRKDEWAEAARTTPHGEPIELPRQPG